MGHYIKRLREGANHREAAEGSGFHLATFYKLRKRDPEFGAMCEEAIARSSGVRFVRGGAKRKLQLRRIRNIRFTPERQAIFLGHFAGTGNTAEAAAEAGVSESTVDKHRRQDPDFERRFLETLGQVHVKLEADLVARRVAAQRLLRDIEPTGEPEPEFDRAMKVLKRWDRRQGPPDSRAVGKGRQKRWQFDEALALLEKKLRNMGYPIGPLPEGCERPDDGLPLPPSGSPDGDGPEGGGPGGAEPEGEGEEDA
jgi:hypothetical protein